MVHERSRSGCVSAKVGYFLGLSTGAELAGNCTTAVASLPRYRLPDDESSSPELEAWGDDDATAPAQFVLKLPESMIRHVTALHPPKFGEAAPSTPPSAWMVQPMDAPPSPPKSWREGTSFVSVVASIILGSAMVVGGMTGVTSAPESGPVGIALHAPKTLDKTIRTRDRVSGYSPRVNGATVSIDSLSRSRRR